MLSFAGRRDLAAFLMFLASVIAVVTIAPIFMDDLFYDILILLPCIVALIGGFLWDMVLVIRAARKRDWLIVVFFSSCYALVACFSITMPLEALDALTRPGDFIKFAVNYPNYEHAVQHLPRDGKRFAEWNWGGMTFASRGVTYDESDEVGLPAGKQSERWIRRFRNTDLTCGGNGPIGPVRHLWGHYYITGFGC